MREVTRLYAFFSGRGHIETGPGRKNYKRLVRSRILALAVEGLMKYPGYTTHCARSFLMQNILYAICRVASMSLSIV